MARAERFTPSRPRPQQDRPGYGDRPSFGGGGSGSGSGGAGGPGGRPAFPPRPPFTPGARPGPDASPVSTAPAGASIRLRKGDWEVEVNGTPAFIRQTLDDLPALFARLAGVPSPTPPAISIPSPSDRAVQDANHAPAAGGSDGNAANDAPIQEAGRGGVRAERTSASGNGTATRNPVADDDDAGQLERDVFAVLRRSKRALTVAGIRAQVNGDVTGQQLRRILERSDRVVSNNDKPAGYRLR